MGKKMMHIALEKGDVGRYVFLPGSPERTEKIAAYFDNPREIAYNREYRTFVGELDGVKVAAVSYTHLIELFSCAHHFPHAVKTVQCHQRLLRLLKTRWMF